MKIETLCSLTERTVDGVPDCIQAFTMKDVHGL